MSLAENRESAFKFFARRVKQDLQFSNIFSVDLVASFGYVTATLFLVGDANPETVSVAALIALGAAYLALQAGKIWLIVDLEKRGGDARQFMGSDHLVTSGVYAFSRNPVYLVSLVQSALWSIALLCLARGQDAAGVGYALAPALLYAHYWGMDRLIVPNEEAALKAVHPEEFAAYAAKVRRWFGRR